MPVGASFSRVFQNVNDNHKKNPPKRIFLYLYPLYTSWPLTPLTGRKNSNCFSMKISLLLVSGCLNFLILNSSIWFILDWTSTLSRFGWWFAVLWRRQVFFSWSIRSNPYTYSPTLYVWAHRCVIKEREKSRENQKKRSQIAFISIISKRFSRKF